MKEDRQLFINIVWLISAVVMVPVVSFAAGLYLRQGQFNILYWLFAAAKIAVVYVLIRLYEIMVAVSFRPSLADKYMAITWRPLIMGDVAALIVLVGYFYRKAYPSEHALFSGVETVYLIALAVLGVVWIASAFGIGLVTLREVDNDLKIIARGSRGTRRVFTNEEVR